MTDQPDGRGTLDRLRHKFAGVLDRLANIERNETAPPADRMTDFFLAVRAGKTGRAGQLLDAGGIDINAHDTNGETALHIAARKDNAGMVAFLLERGARADAGKKNRPGHTPLESAVNFRAVRAAALLAPEGVPLPEGKSWTLLHRACDKDMPPLAAALTGAGADPNAQTADGMTPLMTAVRRRKEKAADFLLEIPEVQQAINLPSARGKTPARTAFQMAVEDGQLELTRKMLDKGALLSLRDGEGMLPLDRAVMNRDLDMVRLLAARGADLLPADGPAPVTRLAEARTPQEQERNDAIREFLLQAAGEPPETAASAAPVIKKRPLPPTLRPRHREE